MILSIKYILSIIIFLPGLLLYKLSRKTYKFAYVSFRSLFVVSRGKLNDLASTLISYFIPKYKETKVSGILGHLSRSDINRICDEVSKNGFHSFGVRLDKKTVNNIHTFASNTKVSYLDHTKNPIVYSDDKVLFNPQAPISPRYQFKNNEIMQNQALKELVFDNSLRAVANEYLQTKPILDIVTMWWSAPFGKSTRDKAAQKYHFDMDRFKFIKFFFYLTDVNHKNGPHCYVRSSHKKVPKTLMHDRRIEDGEIRMIYESKDILELVGEAGTVFAVDTRGFHKGKPLEEGNRLLFQIQFSNSLFGAPFKNISTSELNEDQNKIKNQYQRTFKLFKESH